MGRVPGGVAVDLEWHRPGCPGEGVVSLGPDVRRVFRGARRAGLRPEHSYQLVCPLPTGGFGISSH